MKKFFKIFFVGIGALLVLVAGSFFLVSKLDKDAMQIPGFYSCTYNKTTALLLPSLFINGERFFIKMAAANGDTILAFGDSGGGLCMTFPSVLGKLGLKSQVKTGLLKGVMPMKYIPFYDVIKDGSIPPPVPFGGMILRSPFSRVVAPFLYIPTMDEDANSLLMIVPLDIFLGQNFFMGKSWTFDYINKQVWVNTPLPASEAGKPGVQRIGFKKNSVHQNIFGHASLYIEVDGEIIEVLFDTGASIVLSKNGKKMFNTAAPSIGGSFIARSVFDKWRKNTPNGSAMKRQI